MKLYNKWFWLSPNEELPCANLQFCRNVEICQSKSAGSLPPSGRQHIWSTVQNKGTGTRDYNCLKVVWLDRPELVVLPDSRQKNFNCPVNILFKFLPTNRKRRTKNPLKNSANRVKESSSVYSCIL